MADHTIKIKLTADGTITCDPNVTKPITRGQTITWDGPPHAGTIDGLITGKTAAELSAMSQSEIAKLPRENKIPTDVHKWRDTAVLTVLPNAEPGAYKYTITLPGKAPFDPVIIIGG